MINESNPWRSQKMYSNCDKEEKIIQELTRYPFFYSNDCEIIVKMKERRINLSPIGELKKIHKSIVGILAAGKNMSFYQLYAYLLLMGEDITKEILAKEIEILIKSGLVDKICITQYQGNDQNRTNMFVKKYIYCYRLSFTAEETVKEISAPLDFQMSPAIVISGERGLKYYYSNTILCNQIVLNYLLHDKTIVCYEINKEFANIQYKNLTIPLYIETNKEKYIFEYVHSITEWNIHKVFQKWLRIKKEFDGELKFVLLTESLYNAYMAKFWLRREALNSTLFYNEILFSVTYSWFKDKKGKFFTSGDII